MKLVTRAQLGWPASAAPSQTSTKGVKVHYEGTPVSTRLLTDHTACVDEWKNIRRSHLANKAENYSDVAYNYAACPHGYLMEGRGLGKRTGANGNQALNQGHYAILGLVGSSGLMQPTDAMLDAIRDGIDLLRKNGAGSEIKGHRDGYATTCPGGPLYAWVQKGAPRPAGTSTEPTEEDPMAGITKKDIFDAVWSTDAIGGPADAADHKTNPTWQPQSILKDVQVRVRRLDATVTAQSAAITALAGQVGKGADTAAIVAAVQKAIKDAVIKVDVDINQES
ncbi:peptidoglycan recognition family protein [[Kitasatospora] papulosa]|uniref:Peptidoglycan recognition protein family protein n=1 Tax=[Kitasatospora] papulosa TaxID=1464011 RepID=A0ABZ1KAH2_9ACTN